MTDMTREEAIEVIRKNWPDASFTQLRKALETLIPELAESENEKIRKELAAFFIEVRHREGPEAYWHELKVVDILNWLEKQKEGIAITRDEMKFQAAISCIQGILEAKLGIIGEVVPEVAVKESLHIADEFVRQWFGDPKN